MGYSTYFHGMLEFTRPMTADELAWIDRVTKAGDTWTDEIRKTVWERKIISGPEVAAMTAEAGGFIMGEGLSAGYASHLRISDDRRGLVECCEKTYDMIGGLNFIIVNARSRIPDFGLKGMLAADTEFEPHLWFVTIGKDGMAYGEPTTSEEFLAFRRKLYPKGYVGGGLIDRADRHAVLSWSPTVGTPQQELSAQVTPRGGIEFVAYHEDAGRQIQDVIYVPVTLQEARELGEWLCGVARNLEPAQSPERKSNPIRRLWNRMRGIDP